MNKPEFQIDDEVRITATREQLEDILSSGVSPGQVGKVLRTDLTHSYGGKVCDIYVNFDNGGCSLPSEYLELVSSAGGQIDTKDTNPKEALGIKKVPTYIIPTAPLLYLGLAMMEGGRKYGAHNYRAMGARHSVYLDAIERHRLAFLEGEDIDPDSGLPHLAKIMGCCAVLLDSIEMGNDIDDRPLKYPNGLDMKEFNKLAETIIEKYPECKEPYIEGIKMTNYPKFVDCLKSRRTNPTPKELDILHAVVGLSGESGELLDIIKKYFWQEHDLDRDEIVRELGDIYFYFQFMCNNLDVTLEEIIQVNVSKLTKRYPNGVFEADRSRNREDDNA